MADTSNMDTQFVTVSAATKAKRRNNPLSLILNDRIMTVLSPLTLLLIWELAGHLGMIDQRYFPVPTAIFAAMVQLSSTGELWANLFASLQRLGIGFFVGAVPALVIGVAMGLSRVVRVIVDPLIAATYPIPKSAILPLLLLIFGLGEGSKIAMVAIGAFYPIAINTTAGVLAINRTYFEVAQHFQASRWQVFVTVALPGALPLILTGVKLGLGLGLVLIALAEMVGANNGLGFMIWNAWELLAVETMYAGIITIAFIGFILTIALNELERWLLPWKAD